MKWDRPHVVQKSRHTVPDEVLPHLVIDDSLLCDKLQLNCDNWGLRSVLKSDDVELEQAYHK